MSGFPDLISNYMRCRESRGLQPSPKTAHLLHQFTTFRPTDRDDEPLFTVAEALEWANAPIDAAQALELSPSSTPMMRFLHSLTAACRLSTPLRAATMVTLTGLIAVPGMRIVEAMNLDIGDIDSDQGTVLIRHAKFDCERVVSLTPSAITAISTYLALPNRQRFGTRTTSPLFVSARGIRPGVRTIYDAWHRMCATAGITARAGARPRIHDLRHTFATNSVIDAYCFGNDPAATLSALAIWLGHTSPAYTYWYLEAVPALVASTAELLETSEFSWTALAPFLQEYFTAHLVRHLAATTTTIRTYADTWKFFLHYLTGVLDKPAYLIDLADVEPDHVTVNRPITLQIHRLSVSDSAFTPVLPHCSPRLRMLDR